ncbi:MAG: putative bifunctional diguanylate cyclase/phosphodiesterase, partial [Suilimivivens sp.]
ALGQIAAQYHIGKLIMQFAVPASVYTKGGDKREDILFQADGDVEEIPGYCREFQTGEGGNVKFLLYCTQGSEAYSEEEKKELDVFVEILFFHCGRWRLINHVKKLSLTDGLTGLPNSGGFLTYVDILLSKKELTRYNAYYFNLTRFSLVNKRFGAKETDTIIVRYSEELSKTLVKGECIGRLGGDNFVALILKERTDEFLKLLSGVKTYGILGNQRIPLEISAVAGVFEIDENVVHCGMVIGECATALNIAKHIEKKPYVFASEDIRQRMFKEKQVASGFVEALHRGEFKAYYQPKVETETYRIVGAEALARWEHDGRLVPPVEFVPVLEQSGMICMLDFYILEQVCKDIREWIQKGIEPVRVSVNLSRKHLANTNLSADIMKILDRYELESKYIEVELTETVDEAESAQLVDFMEKMKKEDVALSIDDFGTGYSSLNMLRSFPVDVLKLDRTFLNSLEKSDRIVLSNIIRMASELNMDVVAEGVENWQQVDFLQGMACKVVQGFLFDKPMPREEFEEKLRVGKYKVNTLKS